tara:strand:- start:1505 stop:1753 length:249 start_codon:yes stop_codon:yes gene_type:complete
METIRGVYCVDIKINASPIHVKMRLKTIEKTLHSIPVALDDDLKPINERFMSRAINIKDIHKYNVNYRIVSKKFLSGLCHSL